MNTTPPVHRFARGDRVRYKGDTTTIMKVQGRRTIGNESRISIKPLGKCAARIPALLVLDEECIPA